MRQDLSFKLDPGTAGDDGHVDDREQGMKERRHLFIDRGLAWRERAVEIKDDEFFHLSPGGSPTA